jgi:phage gp29-like protein
MIFSSIEPKQRPISQIDPCYMRRCCRGAEWADLNLQGELAGMMLSEDGEQLAA